MRLHSGCGRGSATDAAKAVGIKLAEPDIDLMHFKSVLRMVKPTPPLIAIPTTAGTGSEVTSAAVISDPDKDIKLSLLSPSMPPHTAVIDPRMTRTLPPRLTAATGMDAMAHAIEACLGAIYHLPHGEAMAICLPDVLEFNLDTVGETLAELLTPMAGPEAYVNTAPDQRAPRVIDILRRMQKDLKDLSGLPVTLEQAGLSGDKLEAVAEISVKDGAAHYNRKAFTPDDALSVLKRMYRGGI